VLFVLLVIAMVLVVNWAGHRKAKTYGPTLMAEASDGRIWLVINVFPRAAQCALVMSAPMTTVASSMLRTALRGAMMTPSRLTRATSIMSLRKIIRFAAPLALLALGGIARAAPIYKCPDANGAVLYADYPCEGGAVLDIYPGRPDPAAEERLLRARLELDRAAAQRRSREEMMAARRDELNRLRREAEAAQAAAEREAPEPEVYYGSIYGTYAPYAVRRPKHPALHKHADASPREADGSVIAKPREHSRGRVPAIVRRPRV
jgi:hypothetical protein